jgi:hypothetical protein
VQKKSSKATAYHLITTIFFVKTSSLEVPFRKTADRGKKIGAGMFRKRLAGLQNGFGKSRKGFTPLQDGF